MMEDERSARRTDFLTRSKRLFTRILHILFSVVIVWPYMRSLFTSLRNKVIKVADQINHERMKEISDVKRYKSFEVSGFPRQFCRVVSASRPWEIAVIMAIIANSAIDGYCCGFEVANDGMVPAWVEVIEIFFLTIYTVEFVVKIIGFGPTVYFMNGWSIFDFIVLIVCYLPYIMKSVNMNLTFLRTFRAFRGIRLLRTVEFNARLQTLFDAVKHTLTSAVWLVVLLFVFILVFAIAGLYCFGEKVPDPWGKLETSLLHTFAITTKDAWNVYQDDLDAAYGESSRVFSVVVVVVCGLIIASLVVAAVTDNFEDSASKQARKLVKIRKARVEQYRRENDVRQHQARAARMDRALKDSRKFENEEDRKPTEAATKGDPIQPHKSMFCNPHWLEALIIVCEQLEREHSERLTYYQRLFDTFAELGVTSEVADRDA